MSELPTGWSEAGLLDVVALHDNQRVPLNSRQRASRQGNYPYYGANGLVDHIDDYIFDGDYVLLAEDGGNFDKPERGVAYGAQGKFWVNNHAHIIAPLGGMQTSFLIHWLNSINWMPYVGGSTRLKLTQSGMKQVRIPLPPLKEQQRIATKVDELTARTARARKDLDRIPTLIARYKQRLLELAFLGELTEAWRKQPGRSAGTDFEKVREFRSQDKRLSRRKRPASLPDYQIPESWSWISPDEVAADPKYSIGIGPFGSNLVRTDYRTSGVRLVFVRDIRRERFDDADARYVDEKKASELSQHIARPGDVLITKMGDPPGDSTLFPLDQEPAIITADCIKLTPHEKLATPSYLNFAIRSEVVQSQFKAITAGVAQQKVSLDRFRKLALPVAPLDEQEEITRRLESAFIWLDRLAADHTAAERLLPKLESAILEKAFRGELVPQDPNDEPANVLLERIEAERTAAPKKKRNSKNKGKKMASKKVPLKDQILADSTDWPTAGLDFFELSSRISAPYDEMRTALFTLLGDPSPSLKQHFDSERETIVIQRIAA